MAKRLTPEQVEAKALEQGYSALTENELRTLLQLLDERWERFWCKPERLADELAEACLEAMHEVRAAIKAAQEKSRAKRRAAARARHDALTSLGLVRTRSGHYE